MFTNWITLVVCYIVITGVATIIFGCVRLLSIRSDTTVIRNMVSPSEIARHLSSEAGSRTIRDSIRNNAPAIRRVLEGNDTAPEESEWINHYTSRYGSRINDRRYNTRTGKVEILYPPPVPPLPETRLLRE